MEKKITTALTMGALGFSSLAPFALDNNNNITISQTSVLKEIKLKYPEQKNSNAFIISHEKLLSLLEDNFFSKSNAKRINAFLFNISLQMANKGFFRKAQF
jgi:hypothetical protein